MSYLDYVCANNETGDIYKLKATEPNNMGFECTNTGGTLLNKNDYLDPKGNQICQNSKRKIFSKKECDKLMLSDPTTKFYTYYKTMLNRPIYPKFNAIPEVREQSRKNVLLSCSALTTLLVSAIIYTSYDPHTNKKSLVYLYSLLGIVIILSCIVYMFCPLRICYLEPDMPTIRVNPPYYVYQETH